jgi:hypothetical protein
MGTHRTESIAGVLARGVAAGPAFVAPPQLRPWTENQRLSLSVHALALTIRGKMIRTQPEECIGMYFAANIRVAGATRRNRTSASGGEGYFALAKERRLWRELRSFPRGSFYARCPPN